jgi:hypothetical protein
VISLNSSGIYLGIALGIALGTTLGGVTCHRGLPTMYAISTAGPSWRC